MVVEIFSRRGFGRELVLLQTVTDF